MHNVTARCIVKPCDDAHRREEAAQPPSIPPWPGPAQPGAARPPPGVIHILSLDWPRRPLYSTSRITSTCSTCGSGGEGHAGFGGYRVCIPGFQLGFRAHPLAVQHLADRLRRERGTRHDSANVRVCTACQWGACCERMCSGGCSTCYWLLVQLSVGGAGQGGGGVRSVQAGAAGVCDVRGAAFGGLGVGPGVGRH